MSGAFVDISALFIIITSPILFFRRKNMRYLFMYVVFFGGYVSLTYFFRNYFYEGESALWLHKISSIAYIFIFIKAMGLGPEEIGLGIPKGINAWAHAALGTFLIVGAYAFISHTYISVVNQSAQYILFKATLPGVDEEIAFRGVGFFLMERYFSKKEDASYKLFAPAVFTAILFEYVHSPINEDFLKNFSLNISIYALYAAIVLSYIRIKSRSVLICIVAHNAANLALLF